MRIIEDMAIILVVSVAFAPFIGAFGFLLYQFYLDFTRYRKRGKDESSQK